MKLHRQQPLVFKFSIVLSLAIINNVLYSFALRNVYQIALITHLKVYRILINGLTEDIRTV